MYYHRKMLGMLQRGAYVGVHIEEFLHLELATDMTNRLFMYSIHSANGHSIS